MILNSINVKHILDEELKNLPKYLRPKDNIVIAGGFAAYVYYKLNNLIDNDSKTYSDLDYFRIGNSCGSELDFLFSDFKTIRCINVSAERSVLSLQRESEHANTFTLDESRIDYDKRFFKPIQGVKYRYSSIKEMFQAFDLHNSQAVIVGDELVYSNEFELSTKNFEISCSNKSFFSEDKCNQSIMFQFNRVMKYIYLMNRVSNYKTPSKMDKFLSDTLMNFLLRIEHLDRNYWKRNDRYVSVYYGRTEHIQSTEKRVYNRFISMLPDFFGGLSSSEQKIMFLINSKNEQIKNASLNYINPNSDKRIFIF